VIPLAATLDAVAALPVVFWLNVGKFVMLAALIVGAIWYDGAPAPPVAGPASTLFWAALDRENVNAGVLVAVATDVVNRGERLPALKAVTEPPPDTHAVPAELQTDTPLPTTIIEYGVQGVARGILPPVSTGGETNVVCAGEIAGSIRAKKANKSFFTVILLHWK
jgi:hypothetical protein